MSELQVIEGALVHQDTAMTALDTGEHVALALERAKACANELKKVIVECKMATLIGDKEHVHIEGWQLLGQWMGVFGQEVPDLSHRLEDGGWESAVELIDVNTGRRVGFATGICGMDETDSWDNETWANRPEYARKSMSITRAEGKAFRLKYSYIMKLAGYSGTPAEEMTGMSATRSAEARQDPASFILTFGKHQTKTLGQILEEDRGYLEFMLSPESARKPGDKPFSENRPEIAALMQAVLDGPREEEQDIDTTPASDEQKKAVAALIKSAGIYGEQEVTDEMVDAALRKRNYPELARLNDTQARAIITSLSAPQPEPSDHWAAGEDGKELLKWAKVQMNKEELEVLAALDEIEEQAIAKLTDTAFESLQEAKVALSAYWTGSEPAESVLDKDIPF